MKVQTSTIQIGCIPAHDAEAPPPLMRSVAGRQCITVLKGHSPFCRLHQLVQMFVSYEHWQRQLLRPLLCCSLFTAAAAAAAAPGCHALLHLLL
jgi:hypothetical protein